MIYPPSSIILSAEPAFVTHDRWAQPYQEQIGPRHHLNTVDLLSTNSVMRQTTPKKHASLLSNTFPCKSTDAVHRRQCQPATREQLWLTSKLVNFHAVVMHCGREAHTLDAFNDSGFRIRHYNRCDSVATIWKSNCLKNDS